MRSSVLDGESGSVGCAADDAYVVAAVRLAQFVLGARDFSRARASYNTSYYEIDLSIAY
jgi:hypothetical protein